jgi:hypothetical protein
LNDELQLSKTEIDRFVKLVESNYFYYPKNAELNKPTAALYFAYCKVAYLATYAKNNQAHKNKNGKELYKIFADNRHEGLLDIDEQSATIFDAWCKGDKKYRDRGGHPFEIIRGGSYSQVNLHVHTDLYHNGYEFNLSGSPEYRLADIVKIALAFHKNKMPFTMSDPIGFRLCLLKQNRCAIIAEQERVVKNDYGSEESEENVYQYYWMENFGKNFNKVKPHITWKELPILRYKF